jgi:ribonuclease T2
LILRKYKQSPDNANQWGIKIAPAILVLALAGSSAPTYSQVWQCVPPKNLARPKLETAPPSAIRRSSIAGYTLALSWSREYCKGKQRNASDNLQCAGKIGEFGFILHGLWPEGRGPKYPQWCRPTALLSPKIIAQNICMMPSVQLQQHEWAKHGSCMVSRPETYFAASRLLFNAIEFPDMDRLSRQGEKSGSMTASDLAHAFSKLNPGLPENAIMIKTGNRGWVKEVRICLNKKFRPVACTRPTDGARPKAQIKIWRGG